MKPVICTVAYGKMVAYFHDLTLKSLAWDIEQLGCEVRIFPSTADFLAQAVSLGYVFFTPPDLIWSRFSLVNMARLAEGLDVAIATPHFRVIEGEVLNRPPALPISGSHLAEYALPIAHRTFKEADDMAEPNCCGCGLVARNLGGLIVLRHSFPNVNLVRMRPDDVAFICAHGWTAWDHQWLGKLHGEQRLKIVGSNQMAMCVELTEREGHYHSGYRNPRYVETTPEDGPHSPFCRSMLYTIGFEQD